MAQPPSELRTCTGEITSATGCTKTLPIALLRYGVMAYKNIHPHDSGEGLLAEIATDHFMRSPFKLGKMLKDFPLPDNTHARYAIRGLRAGYVYFFATFKHEHEKVPQGTWALVGYVETDTEHSGEVRVCGHEKIACQKLIVGNSNLNECGVVNICTPEEITELRVLFHPAPLTPARIDAILKNEDGLRDAIQSFNIEALVKTPFKGDHDDVLPEGNFYAMHCESAAWRAIEAKDPNGWGNPDVSKILSLFNQQYFDGPKTKFNDDPTHINIKERPDISARWRGIARLSTILKNGSEYGKDHGFGIVLNDPIGITQELNDWRNDGWGAFKRDFLDKKVKTLQGHYVTQEYQVTIANAITDLKSNYRLYRAYESIAEQCNPYFNYKDDLMQNLAVAAIRSNAGTLRRTRAYQSFEDVRDDEIVVRWQGAELEIARKAIENLIPAWSDLDAAVRATFTESGEIKAGILDEEEIEGDWEALAGQLDYNAAQKILEEYDTEWPQTETAVLERATPHRAWFESAELLAAFEFFDPQDENNGIYFAAEVGCCIMGLQGEEEGYKNITQLLTLRRPFQAANNLVARATLFNGHELIQLMNDVIDKTTADQDQEQPMGDEFVKAARKTLGYFKKFFDASDKFLQWYGNRPEGQRRMQGLATVLNGVHGMVIHCARNNAADKGMFWVLRTILLGGMVEAVEDVSRMPNAQGNLRGAAISGAAATTKINAQLDRTLNNNATREFAKFRIASAMLVLQGVHAVFQWNAVFRRGESDKFGAALSTTFSTIGACANLYGNFIDFAYQGFKAQGPTNSYAVGLLQKAQYYRVWGGGIGVLSSSIQLIKDVASDAPEFFTTFRQGHRGLATAYGIKTLTNGLLLMGQFYNLHKAFGTYVLNLSRQAASSAAAQAAAVIAGKEVAKRASIWAIGLAGLNFLSDGTVSVILGIVSFLVPLGIQYREDKRPVTLQEWSERSCFAPTDASMWAWSYDDLGKELSYLSRAVQNLAGYTPLTLKDIEYPLEREWNEQGRDEMLRLAQEQLTALELEVDEVQGRLNAFWESTQGRWE